MTPVAGHEAALRGQLASFRPLLALSMVMTGSRDDTEILRIATTAVPSLGGHGDTPWSALVR